MSKGKTYEEVTRNSLRWACGVCLQSLISNSDIKVTLKRKEYENKVYIQITIFAAMTSLTASLCSCDNPQTIAWSCYYCAKDTMEAGDPYAALDFLEGAHPGLDSILDRKADSLRLVIEKAIEEDKNKTAKDSI